MTNPRSQEILRDENRLAPVTADHHMIDRDRLSNLKGLAMHQSRTKTRPGHALCCFAWAAPFINAKLSTQ